MLELQQELNQRFGTSATFDLELRQAYDHDLGEMPSQLMAMLRRVPDAVVVARSEADVAEVLRIAKRFKVPVTPRGQASSGYGGAIPTKAGILLDLSEMRRVLSVDPAAGTVDVEPGVVWNQLSRTLLKEGLDIRICPTSGPSSTVGGWLAMGGVGIGSLQYGSVLDIVREIDVVDLDGTVTTHSGESLVLFHQTCGILGVVTRLRLLCRRAEAMRPFAVRLPGAKEAMAFLARVQSRLSPYSLALHSSGYLALRAEAEGHHPPFDRGFLAILAIPVSLADPAKVVRVAEDCGGALLDQELAEQEWADRFYPMRIKKLGPSTLVSEFFVPAKGFSGALEAVEAELTRDVLGMEAMAVSDGRLAVLVYMLDDAKDLLYPVRMAKAMIPLRIAERFGGSVYASGLWFASEAPRFFGAAKYKMVMECKRRSDPDNLLNPGKIRGPKLPWLPLADLSSLIRLGGGVVAPLSKRLAYKRTFQAASAEE